MATLFMRIDKNEKIKGGATVEKIGGKEGWFALQSVSWSGARGVNIEIGNAENRDSGIVHMGEISCSKSYDGASPFARAVDTRASWGPGAVWRDTDRSPGGAAQWPHGGTVAGTSRSGSRC